MLLIGIDEYVSPQYSQLDNAKEDLERFRGILEIKYGFTPFSEPLYDRQATRVNILEALNSLAFHISPEDNVIIYYAGHGQQHPSSGKGFWVPNDAHTQTDFIRNSQIIDIIEGIPAKHILLISDSCFSGTFLTKTRGPGKILNHDELESLNSRWVFVSGGEEPVSDGEIGKGSPFNQSICNFLQSNEAPTLSASQLFDSVIRDVSSKRKQTPQAALIRCDGNKGGEMIFRLRASISSNQTKVQKLNFPLPKARRQASNTLGTKGILMLTILNLRLVIFSMPLIGWMPCKRNIQKLFRNWNKIFRCLNSLLRSLLKKTVSCLL